MLMAQLGLAGGRGIKESRRVTASHFFVRAEKCLVPIVCYFAIEEAPVATVLKPAVRVWAVGTWVIIPLEANFSVC